jgi:hypothetical protein
VDNQYIPRPLGYKLFLVFFLLIHNIAVSQTIKGTVLDEERKPLSGVPVILKDKDSVNQTVSYTFSNDNGEFKIEIPSKHNSLVIVFNLLGFSTKEVIHRKDQTFYEVILSSEPIVLNEAYINADKPKILKNKDTTIFNIPKIIDGSELVIQDVLKKLPGIEIDDNGLIQFEGQPVSHILLDSENIFNNSSYSVGTQNINADIIEGVEAIKNYTENTVLRGFKKNNQIALNLKLKNTKGDLSGDLKAGIGVDNRSDVTIHGLWVSKPVKSFNFINYNNIGADQGDFKNLYPSSLLEDRLEKIHIPEPIILINSINSILPSERTRINNDIYVNTNNVFKPTEKTALHLNLGLNKDNLTQNTRSFTNYQPSLGITNIDEKNLNSLTPINGYAKIKFVALPTSSSRLSIDTELEDNNIENPQSIIINNNEQFSKATVESKLYFNKLSYTTKLNKKWAINTALRYQDIINNQSFVLSQKNNDNFSNQSLEVSTNSFQSISNIIYNIENLNIDMSFGYENRRKQLESKLLNDSLQSNNNLRYGLNDLFFSTKLDVVMGDLNITSTLKLSHLHQIISSENSKKYDKLIFNPEVQLRYKLNYRSWLDFSIGQETELVEEKNLFENYIQNSNRTFSRNNTSLKPIIPLKSTLQYSFNDQFSSFMFNTIMSMEKRSHNFIPSTVFDGVNSFVTYNFSESNSEYFTLSTSASKYLGFIKSNLKIRLSSNLFNFQNKVNDSDIRDNRSVYNNLNLILKTGFLEKFNFENNFQIGKNQFQNDIFRVSNQSWSNSFSTYYTDSKFKFSVSLDYVEPSNANINGIFFIDAFTQYSNKKGTINYSLTWNNTNFSNSLIQEKFINDISETITEIKLQDSYLMFKMQLKL